MLERVHHIGIAVADLDATVELYRAAFGIHEWERVELPERHMEVAVCRVGDTLIELMMPTSEQAAFATFLRERGEGLHHLAFQVSELEPALRTLQDRGIRLIDAHGRPGLHDSCVAFIHPKALHGVLAELVQPGAVPASEE